MPARPSIACLPLSLAALPALLLPALGCASARPQMPEIRVGGNERPVTAEEDSKSGAPRRAKPRSAGEGGGSGGGYSGGDDDDDGFLACSLEELSSDFFSCSMDGSLLDSERGGLVLGVHRIPALGLRPDRDDREPGGGLEIDADWRTGDGYALEVGVREGIAGFGLLHIASSQYERFAGHSTDLHGTFAELRLYADVPLGPVEGALTLAAGMGYAGVYFDEPYEDTGGTAVEMRGTLGLRLARQLGFEVGGGFLEWGVPGETIGKGSFATVGLTWHPR